MSSAAHLEETIAEYAHNETLYRNQLRKVKADLAAARAENAQLRAQLRTQTRSAPQPVRYIPRRAQVLSGQLVEELGLARAGQRDALSRAARTAAQLQVELSCAAEPAQATSEQVSAAGMALIERLQELAKRQQGRIAELAAQLYAAQCRTIEIQNESTQNFVDEDTFAAESLISSFAPGSRVAASIRQKRRTLSPPM